MTVYKNYGAMIPVSSEVAQDLVDGQKLMDLLQQDMAASLNFMLNATPEEKAQRSLLREKERQIEEASKRQSHDRQIAALAKRHNISPETVLAILNGYTDPFREYCYECGE